nr:hypothetical protein GCM10025699_70580 [Microbacterium flavescens]
MVRSPAAWLLTLAIVLIALNLRGPIVATAPVLDQMSGSLGLTAVVAGLLTSIPVLCFAVASPAASALIGRVGPELAVTVGLAGVLAGTVLRTLGTSFWLYAGTIVIGVAITIGNVVLPVIIKRDFSPERGGFVTGIYTSALNVGSMITSLGTAPIAAVVGWPSPSSPGVCSPCWPRSCGRSPSGPGWPCGACACRRRRASTTRPAPPRLGATRPTC